MKFHLIIREDCLIDESTSLNAHKMLENYEKIIISF